MTNAGGRQPGYKLVLLGDASVGKTSLVGRFVSNQFNEAVETTVGAAFSTQSVTTDKGRTIKYEIWDTAGQERFKSLAPMYYRNASCAVVVFDLTSESSFNRAKDWVKQLALSNNPDIVIALAGNKSDIPTSQRQVKAEEIKQFALDESLVYMETSAKTGNNVQKLFETIANKLPDSPFTPASLGGASAARTTAITIGPGNAAPASSGIASRCCGGS
jgi:Ras-related protein Rab-5C